MVSLSKLRIDVERFAAVLEERQKALTKLQTEATGLREGLKPVKDAISLAKKCLEESLAQKKYIEEIVSAGLTEVFGIEYTFVLEIVLGDDNTIKGLKPRLKEAGGELDDPMASFGAGAQSIASVCFRMALLLLTSGTAKVLILDEPLANVSPALQSRFQQFVETTCNETGLQLIMVTHMDQPFGRVYEVSKDAKKQRKTSIVREMEK